MNKGYICCTLSTEKKTWQFERKKEMYIPMFVSFKNSSAILRCFMLQTGILVYNSQVVLKNDNAHIFLSGFFFLGFPLMLKLEKKYHSTVINNAGSCSINR